MRHRVDVVVPARDEADHIGACLTALVVARRELRRARPRVACGITVVLDACTDASPEIARRILRDESDAVVLEVRSASVGRARAAGVVAALAVPGPRPRHRWIANTDADSRVGRSWLVQQADALRRGVDVLVGAVVPDPADLDPVALDRWRDTHPRGLVLGHTHGANLGVRADVYATLGGFEPVAEHEDVGLVDRARTAGRRVDAVGAVPVVTSGRRQGRTGGGYAGHLLRTYGPLRPDGPA